MVLATTYSGVQGRERLLREHYEGATLHVSFPHKREFAHPVQNRYNYYQNVDDLRAGILGQSKMPDGVYASTHRYLDPHNPVIIPDRINCDLVFDLDSDDEFDDKRSHIEHMARMTVRLVNEFLIDLGFSLDDMLFEYSGNKGFHIVIDNPDYQSFTKTQRRNLLKYIQGANLDRNLILPNNKPSLYGWGRQLPYMLSDMLEGYGHLMFTKNKQKLVTDVLNDSDKVRIISNGSLVPLYEVGIKPNDLIKAVMARHKSLDKVLDPKPTVDLRRIFRVPGSIHGKSGLASVRLDWEQMQHVDLVIDEIMRVGGEDEVMVVLDETTTINFPFKVEFCAGEHEVPRWLALCLLSKI
tara:strand:+ start:739 stop:1797 length:1059 start_codon:yes stop_codon:yes gene_type:complete